MTRLIVSLVLLIQLCLAALAFKVDQPNKDSVWIYGRRYKIALSGVTKDLARTRWQVDLLVMGAECNEGLCIKDGPVARIADNFKLSKKYLEWEVPSNLAHRGKGFIVQFSNKGNEPLVQSEIFTIDHMGILEDEPAVTPSVEKRADPQQSDLKDKPASHAVSSAVTPATTMVLLMAVSFVALML
ncbi:hypothetical protein BGW42_005158 [Actinomortierella wolfii]|nr:hypothetical protein BGW42_005158 [Actinomortierella wolfii]